MTQYFQKCYFEILLSDILENLKNQLNCAILRFKTSKFNISINKTSKFMICFAHDCKKDFQSFYQVFSALLVGKNSINVFLKHDLKFAIFKKVRSG